MGQAQQEIVELDMKDLEEILRRIEANQGTAEDHEAIRTLSVSYVRLLEMLKDKNTKIGRLRKLLFGASTEKTDTVLGDTTAPATSSSSEDEDGDAESSDESVPEENSKPPPRGHGRNGADAYQGAETIRVSHESHQPGDACPECEDGTLYETNRPGVLVRIVGQAPLDAKVYELQKLRCNLCGRVFTAAAPEDVGEEKYDATVASMIGLLKYGSGLPFNRLAGLQGHLGIPLPASTQWDLIHGVAPSLCSVYEELIRQAAQGEVLHNDDTTVKILELMGQRAKQAALNGDSAPSSGKKSSERRGLFTSGIVSLREGRRIALFFTGRQHAGENLKDVLDRRAATLGLPIQMCDALSRNMSSELKTIVANCLAHGRRQFVDVVEHFPHQCRHVLETLSVIYQNDAEARNQNLSPEARLQFHQTESGPVMAELRSWLTRQFEEKRVEPNSGLGQAITYLLRHWEKLTRFLHTPGAPLDNNICERALKKAILHRKNSLFYKTLNGAHVGDVYMSLIYTCELCGASPFDYLTELQRHVGSLAASPQDWMPWNYQETLAV